MSRDNALDDDNSIPQEAPESMTEDGPQGETNVKEGSLKCRRGVKVFFVALVVTLVALVSLVVLLVVILDHRMPWASGSDEDDDPSGSLDDDDDKDAANTLAHVRELGKLKCGIVSGIVSEGFSRDLVRCCRPSNIKNDGDFFRSQQEAKVRTTITDMLNFLVLFYRNSAARLRRQL